MFNGVGDALFVEAVGPESERVPINPSLLLACPSAIRSVLMFPNPEWGKICHQNASFLRWLGLGCLLQQLGTSASDREEHAFDGLWSRLGWRQLDFGS